MGKRGEMLSITGKGDHGLGERAIAFLNRVARGDLMKESMRRHSQ